MVSSNNSKPIILVLDGSDIAIKYKKYEEAVEEPAELDEIINVAVDCLQEDNTSNIEVKMYTEGLLENNKNPLTLETSLYYILFEIIADLLKDKLNTHTLYNSGKFNYIYLDRVGSSFRLIRKDFYQKMINDDLSGKTNSFLKYLIARS